MRRIALTLLVACGKGSESGSPPPDASLADSGLFGDPVDAGLPECAKETKEIFLLSEESSLYAFDPQTLAFKNLGHVDCPAGGATPTSMAVDRFGGAWVRHSDGSLWKVSTKDASCAATKFVSLGDMSQFFKFGMGFSTSTKNGSTEELFLSDNGGAGLAKLDLTTMKVGFLGAFGGVLADKTAELTGTGDGKLYGFFVTVPAQVAEISKSTGRVLSSTPLPAVDAGDAWAFSFYGGDFYIYTHARSDADAGGGGSDVTRFRPSDGSITLVKEKVGFKIVGAGVSTCVPTELPR